MESWVRKVDDVMQTFHALKVEERRLLALLRVAELGNDFLLHIKIRARWFDARERASAMNMQIVRLIENRIEEDMRKCRKDKV